MNSFASHEDPQDSAWQLRQRSRQWICWYGNRTGRYWGVTRYGPPVIAEGGTPKELLGEIIRLENSGALGLSRPGG